jgi:hypothetical protein
LITQQNPNPTTRAAKMTYVIVQTLPKGQHKQQNKKNQTQQHKNAGYSDITYFGLEFRLLGESIPNPFGLYSLFYNSKKHLFYFTTHFYITPPIPFSTLQNILLK